MKADSNFPRRKPKTPETVALAPSNPWADRLNKKLAAEATKSKNAKNGNHQATINNRFQSNTPRNSSRKNKKGFRVK